MRRVAAWVSRLFIDTTAEVAGLKEQLKDLKVEAEKRDEILSTSCRPDLNHTDEWWRHPDTETDSDAKQ